MKNKYTRENIVTFIKNLDVRAQKFSDEQIDNVINRGYAELGTKSKRVFSNEDVVDLKAYYDDGELRFSLDVEDDASEVYDLYFTVADKTDAVVQQVVQGIGIYRNEQIAYRDNRYTGRIHINLTEAEAIFDDLVVKYFYTPTANDLDVYMDAQTYLAWQDAMWAAVNYFLKDIEGESQKRASMDRTSKSMVQSPEDETGQNRSLFGGLGI